MERVRYIFRDSLERLQRLVALQVDPADVMRRPRLYLKAPWTALLTPAAKGAHRAGAGPRNDASANCRS